MQNRTDYTSFFHKFIHDYSSCLTESYPTDNGGVFNMNLSQKHTTYMSQLFTERS